MCVDPEHGPSKEQHLCDTSQLAESFSEVQVGDISCLMDPHSSQSLSLKPVSG